MARNRMIKAEFFRDKKVGALSPWARLLFLSMLVHSDDGGDGRADARVLRADAFPYDDNLTVEQVESALQEIATAGMAELIETSGERYYRIRNFHKHQVINRPSEFRYIPEHEPALNTHEVLSECSLTKEKGKEKVKEKGKVNGESGSVSPEKVFEQVRRIYRKVIGKSIGSLSGREREWAGLVARAGESAVLEAVRLWARENKDFLKTSSYPLAHFLKNNAEWIEAAGIERERQADPESKSQDGFIEDTTTPTVDDIRPPDYAPLKRNVQ